MSNVVHGVYFSCFSNSWVTQSDIEANFGTGCTTKEKVIAKVGETTFKTHYTGLWDRFQRLFLSAVIPGDYYFFIIANDQLPWFQKHVDEYGMKPYEKYRNKVPISNRRYGKEARLNVFIYQFDEEFANKWKEWSSK